LSIVSYCNPVVIDGNFDGNKLALKRVTAIRKAKPAAKAYKLRDGRGLYLLIQPNGARWWRWDTDGL